MKTKIFALTMLFIWMLGTSCKKFLAVDPKASVGDEELFKTEAGFQQALSGLYSKMASRSLYGEHLTMGFASIIAQNYSASISPNFAYPEAAALSFRGSDALASASQIWSTGYNVIAGANNMLEKIDSRKTIFTADNFALTKGEALGIRAYIHFDLLRLFGANFATNPTKKAIPYCTVITGLSKIPSTVDEVSAFILADLKEAETLMKAKDPILTDKNRRFRMNYYAIKALQARVYLFRGDKDNARAAASEVVNAGVFKLIDPPSVSADPTIRDRTFSTEQVLAIRVRDIRIWVETGMAFFKPTPEGGLFMRRTADIQTLYESTTGGSTDIRFLNLISVDGVNSFSSKYWQTWAPVPIVEANRLDQNVSLIRLSELYYILAETAATPVEGFTFLNLVREKRVIPVITTNLTAQRLTDEITKEYQKDFYAEGQLFYYYKRKLFIRMLFLARNLTETNYTVPVPDNELEYNPNYN